MEKNKDRELIVRYDRDADALSFVLQSGREDRFEELAPGVSVEFDRRGNVLGFEILRASRYFKTALKPLSEKIRETAVSGAR